MSCAVFSLSYVPASVCVMCGILSVIYYVQFAVTNIAASLRACLASLGREGPSKGSGEVPLFGPREGPDKGPREGPNKGARERFNNCRREGPNNGPRGEPKKGPREGPNNGSTRAQGLA